MTDLGPGADVPLERILVASLARTTDFVKFAEAKNAGLLTLASAWMIASLNLLSGDKHLPTGLATGLCLALPLSICAAISGLLAFMPRTNLPVFLGGKRAGPHPRNLLYFGDVSALTVKEFGQELRRRYVPPAGEAWSEDYLNDLIVQVTVNSHIAMRKLRLFRIGMAMILVAAALLLVPSLGGAIHRIALW